ncbi:MAG: DUF58 domain-containing protein [Candidatus Dormibacteria bacterium]
MARASMLAVLAVVGFFAFLDASPLAFILIYAALLLALAAWAWSLWSVRSVTLTRRASAGLHTAGELFLEHFLIANRSSLPIAPIQVQDRSRVTGYDTSRTVAVGPHQELAWETALRLRRGRHQLGPTEVSLSDPFGLFPRRLKYPARSTVLVLPALQPVPELTGGWFATGLEAGRHRGLRDIPPNASGIREHDPADGIGRIHWVSTARTGRLMSRTFDSEDSPDLLVLLDMRHRHTLDESGRSSLEAAVSAAGSVAHAALGQGQAVALLLSDRQMSMVPAGRGQAHERRLMEALALALPDGQVPLASVIQSHLPPRPKTGQLVLITRDESGAWVDAIAGYCEPGHRALGVFVDAGTFRKQGRPTPVPAQWRLVLDLWVIRNGDDFVVRSQPEEASLG